MLNDIFEEQINLQDGIDKFIDSTRPKTQNKKKKKHQLMKEKIDFLKIDKKVLVVLKINFLRKIKTH